MTPTDIVKALGYFAAEQPDTDEDWKSSHLVEFALDMVRQHNEELALSWERQHGYDKFHVAKFIREAKP